MHITNSFVTVADDCRNEVGVVPQGKGGKPTVASLEYALLAAQPYAFTLNQLIFEVHLARSGVTEAERATRGDEIWAALFARPHPCMRASPLTKTYGWGAHYDSAGKLAIFGRDTADYARLSATVGLDVVKAMRSRRA